VSAASARCTGWTPLAGSIVKLNRAQEHLQALGREIESFLGGHLYDAAVEDDGTVHPVVRLRNVTHPRAELSALIGDFIYNVRSALDHAAYDLTRLGSGNPPPQALARRSAFPIFNNGPAYRRRHKNGQPTRTSGHWKVQGMPSAARGRIERFQPYHRRKRPTAKSLWILEELSNVDKHRLLHLTTTDLTGATYKVTASGQKLWVQELKTKLGPLQEGAIVTRIRADVDPGAHMHVEANTVLDVTFDKKLEAKSARGLRVMSTLNEISDFVALEIMPELAASFPGLRYGMTQSGP
jgi:hypothetical protein